MKQIFTFLILISVITSCTEKEKQNKVLKLNDKSISVSNLTGNELASVHCARCHRFVKPQLLSKSIWKNSVLPSMRQRLGIYINDKERESLFGSDRDSTIRKANIYPKTPFLAKEDWDKIENYYIMNSPDSIPVPKRDKKIKMGLKHFKYKETSYSLRPPFTLMVKILPNNKGFVYSDSKRGRNAMVRLNSNLEKVSVKRSKKAIVNYLQKSDTLYSTSIGYNLFPTDLSNGEIQKVYNSKTDKNKKELNLVIDKLQRPVFIACGDLNNNGLEDIVVCEFGNYTGKLSWFENKGNNKYKKRILRKLPGAIKVIIKDINHDGYKDIVALMAQADEGIFLYENKGDGNFKERRLLSFSPLNGSQNIELVDMNKDGFDDIVYTCGDNADKSPILKNYHGIYIYLNDGKFNFTKAFFYQMNGAYKAMVRDYDLDGDLDIAAISFFPDYVNYPEESFIYLENKGDLKFEDYSFPESTNGRWIVMDAADMDGDGDVDIALGSFVYFKAKGDKTGLGKKWFEKGPSIVVLENTTK